MKNINNTLAEAFDRAQTKARGFYSPNCGALKRLIKKLLQTHWRYGVLLLCRIKILSSRVKARLFTGQYIYLDLFDGNNERMWLFGILSTKEASLTNFLIKTLKPGMVFYDIGASYGFYSLLGSALIKNEGVVHSFEPNKYVLPFLERSIALYNKNITLHKVAIGRTDGELTFFDYADVKSTSESSLYAPGGEDNSAYTTYAVTVTTLDTFLTNNRTPDIIKVDIESAEYDFLLGAKHCLATDSPQIILELKTKTDLDQKQSLKCIEYLIDLSYTPWRINAAGDLIPFDHKEWHKMEVSYENVVFKK